MDNKSTIAEDEDSWGSSISSGSDSDDGMDVDGIIAKEIKNADPNCPPTFLRKSGKNLEWDYFLLKQENLKHVAPVKIFKHAPLANVADSFFKLDLLIECFNPYVKCAKTVNWLATVVHFAGYRALVKFHTLDGANTKDRLSWIDFCSDVPKPLGYSVSNKILLFPPYDVCKSCPNFLEEVKKRFPPDSPTVSPTHSKIVRDAILATQKYKVNDVVEIIDKTFSGQNLLACVTGVLGDRVHCTYLGHDKNDTGFWISSNSDVIHDIGFSQAIGYSLAGIRVNMGELYDREKIPEIPSSIPIQKGMIVEARHPVMTYRIAFGRVKIVHKYGYFTVSFGPFIEFLYHVTSPYILHCGFAKSHGIDLFTHSNDIDDRNAVYEQEKYKRHLKPLSLHPVITRAKNPFEVGMKMEAVDICRPAYVGPATVTKIAGHLMLLHFDGWDRTNEICYQWVDYESPEIYPLGWSTLVGHELQSFPENHRPVDESNRKNPNLPNVSI